MMKLPIPALFTHTLLCEKVYVKTPFFVVEENFDGWLKSSVYYRAWDWRHQGGSTILLF